MDEESLFMAALERPTVAERRAFLHEACAGDDGLRQRVERLLAAHWEIFGILDEVATSSERLELTAGSAQRPAPARERVGTVVGGRYRLVEKIGTGWMGSVWKAEELRPIRRVVTLKLIKAAMDSRTVLSRFNAERQALALLEHPNIARVLDGGTADGGRPFFVMEYVMGVPITDYCDKARLAIRIRLALFLRVCHAVQHAHAKGVIHRDLKPSNILVGRYDGQPMPKVIDFGLARAIEQPLTERTLHTADGVLFGSPPYMSPEQAESNSLGVDARTDVYALGAILYELLTGTTPLERQRFQDATWRDFRRLITREEPLPPSARLSASDALPRLAAQRRLEPVRLTRLVRGELDWIVMKCLEKDPARRYATADDLARDVERYLADEPVQARSPSAGYRRGRALRRNRGPMLAASFILILLTGGIAGTTWILIRADPAREPAAAHAQGVKESSANEKAEAASRKRN
jgi:eukaryotic-like serine/threonine-protein kinase